MYTVSITSQGQMSIPAPLRQKLGLQKKTKAIASAQNGKLVVEPAQDLLDLYGSLNKYVKKGLSSQQVLKMEKKAVEDARLERYMRKEKSSGIKLLKIKTW